MQPGRTTNTGGGTMEVVAAAPRCQLLLILLMAVMLLPGMKGSLLLVQRTVTRTIMLQESIGKGNGEKCTESILKLPIHSMNILPTTDITRLMCPGAVTK
ncbi:hypothetical protein STEG23_003194, partial [Scotinomys teguina]